MDAPPISSPKNFPSRAMTRTQTFVETASVPELPVCPPAFCIANTTLACRMATTDANPLSSSRRLNVPAVIPGASAIAHLLQSQSRPQGAQRAASRFVSLHVSTIPLGTVDRQILRGKPACSIHNRWKNCAHLSEFAKIVQEGPVGTVKTAMFLVIRGQTRANFGYAEAAVDTKGNTAKAYLLPAPLNGRVTGLLCSSYAVTLFDWRH